MFDRTLIESGRNRASRRAWATTGFSALIHLFVLGSLVAGYWTHQAAAPEPEPIRAFLAGSMAPPPPPPPPPPPGDGSASMETRPVEPIEKPEPVEQVKPDFVAPRETPRELPEPEPRPETDTADSAGGGVAGGIEGGVVGGVVGGTVGGVVGGTIGGTLGGIIGGQLGGTGDGLFRVGGDVKPPVPIETFDPIYTEDARKARTQGIVILEAVIDSEGRVKDLRVIKALPNGLDTAALDAVRRWRFRPGTREGRPVPVIFNLTVNFRLQ
jgi:periplasmic protein TonB